ncbi:hypothetical protein [Microbacterium sp. P05]
MTDDKKQIPDELNEGSYTDEETKDGQYTHEADVTPGEYTDIDLGDGASK